MNYLFFDIECANNEGGKSKICSFGYVLTDDEFKIIEKKDIVINPKSKFDFYLFKKNSKCKLAYEKEYFLIQEDFKYYYETIKNMLEDKNNIVFGYAIENDYHFLNSDCARYELEKIKVESYDVEKIYKKYESEAKRKGGLSKNIENIDNDEKNSLIAHKSCDDAHYTMLLLKEVKEKLELNLKEIFFLSDAKKLIN